MTIVPYNRKAQTFFSQYQSLTFEQVHSDRLDRIVSPKRIRTRFQSVADRL
ncbi:hypothetical protein [Marinobacter orientalis]|uniref:Uncharacterized protein n=1 Tax=Marinobacter orientalis TaxID=1928859 RepID=A0A7Y0WS66_9GAMM|nr:hypothetical protein [Marinobacter orientalis]NMT63522.1 hypothetical protein [Marinobacter orientalis]